MSELPPILLVEDTITQRLIMESLLTAEGYNVESVPSAEAAIEWLERNEPRIVLTDINMPGQNGYQLCRYLKNKEQFKNAPIILLESMRSEKSLLEILNCGADGFLYKELEDDYFVPTLAKLLTHIQGPPSLESPVLEMTVNGVILKLSKKQAKCIMLTAFDTAVYLTRKVEALA